MISKIKPPKFLSGFLYQTESGTPVTIKNIISELKKTKRGNNNKPDVLSRGIIIPPFTMPPDKNNHYEILKFDIVLPKEDYYQCSFKGYLYPLENKTEGKIKHSVDANSPDDGFSGIYYMPNKKHIIIYGKWTNPNDKIENSYFIELSKKISNER